MSKNNLTNKYEKTTYVDFESLKNKNINLANSLDNLCRPGYWKNNEIVVFETLDDYVSPNKEEEEFAKNLSQKESWITRVNGVKKIQDEKLLVKYFNDDIEDVRMQVAKRLRDDDLIINHFVKETDASDVTEEVVKSLQNEDLIVKHFANSRYWSVKIAVIKKLSDEDKIIKLFAKDKDEDIRISAAARIKDKERLLKHFAKDKSDKVRLEVLKKMKNKKDIEPYFLNDKAYMVRSFAKKKLGINDY